ncbi:HDOD domain-containing protein [Psychrobium sp. 1_MG-2023]|uniref:HDOD domain-containing protein n=1 Tax=Psychrobium sp. 1_MG-2023 TaxID=3062624 RepID=UPI000C31DA05|nr:HDOD domain-containing protein [Psychrobium sp. 1_MG-2023]MDP2562229.1 HDOD domain-containing protein [Psychrobium sp. 1_MG-2023]PKF57483.1 histidine kinase [Alteromonadales bacterium alter-6D02]
MSTANALRTILIEKLKNDSLVLPTLPKIAMKVREAVADPDSSLGDISSLLAQDAAMSARLIRIANTAHYSRAVRAENLQAAVTRIGMRQIKNIVMALAMEQLFVSDNELVANYLAKTWHNSTEVAAYAMALLSIYQRENKHTSLQVDTLSLAALLHNIGTLPILTEADGYPEIFAEPEFLERAISDLHTHIGVAIVKDWNFSDEMVESVKYYNKNEHQTAEVSYLDFVRLAVLCQAYDGALTNCEDQLTPFIEKGLIGSIEDISSDSFNEELAGNREAFA